MATRIYICDNTEHAQAVLEIERGVTGNNDLEGAIEMQPMAMVYAVNGDHYASPELLSNGKVCLIIKT